MTTLSSEQIYAAAIKAGFDHATATTMTAIALAESGGNSTAHNATYPDNSYGLWQINMLGAMGPARRNQFGIANNEALYDPTANAKAAYAIYKQQGLKAWSTYTSGAAGKKMGQAQVGATQYDALKGKVDQAQKDINANQPGIVDKIVTSGPADAVAGAVSPFAFVGDAWTQINDRWFWVRMSFIVGGFIVILIGVSSLTKGGTLTEPTPATPIQENNSPSVIGKAKRGAADAAEA